MRLAHRASRDYRRRTKIVATLGPATDKPAQLRRLIRAGVDVVRLNFSHGSLEEHKRRLQMVRAEADRVGRNVGTLADLQGPKIRTGRLEGGRVQLRDGQDFIIDTQMGERPGDAGRVGSDYSQLAADCPAGSTLLLDDGSLVLSVRRRTRTRLYCKVVSGGPLSDHKGINLEGGGLSAPFLTAKDRRDMRAIKSMGVDFVAVSFPRNADDIRQARRLLRGSQMLLVAKIERAESATDQSNLEAIIDESDLVMVARGDLGVEVGDAELIGIQKNIIATARRRDRGVITATQMMESMIQNPRPTRAEVFDVANAVLDGTDAVMLSAETAIGNHPVATVEAMVRIIMGAERQPSVLRSRHRMDRQFTRIDEALAMSTMYAANHLAGVRAIISFTSTGRTAKLMSRVSSGLPIFALTDKPHIQRTLALYRGVTSIAFNAADFAPQERNAAAVRELMRTGALRRGNLVLITRGDHLDCPGGTNTMKIVRAGDRIV